MTKLVKPAEVVVPIMQSFDNAKLSPRELLVVTYLALGLTNRDIGEICGISQKTIDTHRGHVMRKLNARNNADMTRWAIAVRLITVEGGIGPAWDVIVDVSKP